jgi:hypothetical protein
LTKLKAKKEKDTEVHNPMKQAVVYHPNFIDTWMKYKFCHPRSRVFVATFISVMNFYIYVEDPIAHSSAPANIPIIGNVLSFTFGKWPGGGATAIKLVLTLLSFLLGTLFSK